VKRTDVTFSLDPTTYVLSLGLGADTTKTIDLPLETMVVGASYNDETKL
jgi:hypothetical protein